MAVLQSSLVNVKVVEHEDRTKVRSAFLSLTNAGDGNAYDVELYGDRADVATVLPAPSDVHPNVYAQRVPVIRAGETIELRLIAAASEMDDATVFVRWTTHPGRSPILGLRPRIQKRVLDIEEGSPFPVGMHGTEPLPRFLRRWRSLSNRTPRGRLESPWSDADES